MKEFETLNDIPGNFTGICKIIHTNTIYHFKNGMNHNENGPAIICKNLYKVWYINDLEHREDGPSAEYVNGDKDWCFKNKKYGESNDFTIESWKEFVENLKREEELKIFI